jgi:GT2 family glycosyltransferase
MKLVTVIVLNWNRADMLLECLDALYHQLRLPDRVVVVDNGSEDGSMEKVRRLFPRVDRIPLPVNMGFCRANNIALETVDTSLAVLLNNDAIAHPKWLEALLEAMIRYPDAGFAASKMLFADHPDRIDRAGDGYSLAGAGILRGRGCPSGMYDSPEWIFGACAGAAIYRMAMLRDIGFLDEDFFLLNEDVDLSFRAQLRGYRCMYVPEAKVFHRASSTIRHDSPVSVYYGHRNLEWVYLKNMPRELLPASWHHHVLYNLFAGAFFCFRGLWLPFVRAKIDAAAGLRKNMGKREIIQAGRKVESRYIRSIMTPEHLMDRVQIRKKKEHHV